MADRRFRQFLSPLLPVLIVITFCAGQFSAPAEYQSNYGAEQSDTVDHKNSNAVFDKRGANRLDYPTRKFPSQRVRR
jgi:hypothetical protein